MRDKKRKGGRVHLTGKSPPPPIGVSLNKTTEEKGFYITRRGRKRHCYRNIIIQESHIFHPIGPAHVKKGGLGS